MWHMYLNRVVLQPLFLLQYIACNKNISFTSELYRLLVEGGIGIGKSTMRSYIFANHFLRFYGYSPYIRSLIVFLCFSAMPFS